MSIVVKEEDLPAGLAKLLSAAKAGKEVVITAGNMPYAKVVPLGTSERQPRHPGTMPELRSVPKGFYEPLAGDELAAWE